MCYKYILDLRKNPVKCYIKIYCAGSWTLRKVDHKYLETLKFGAGEGLRRSVGPIV